jgi:hypothetical protein
MEKDDAMRVAGMTKGEFKEALEASVRHLIGVELFSKTYDGESLYDLDRDIAEAMMAEYNDKWSEIPSDEYGIPLGEFHVTVVWGGKNVADEHLEQA